MIRKLTRDDLAAYRALHREALVESGSVAFVQSVEEDAIVPDSEIAAVLARGEGWGGFIDGMLAAKMTIDTLPHATLAHTRWLHALYVQPRARGTGLARAMVEAAMHDAIANGATRFLLWVNAENAGARRFYEKLGFGESGRIPEGIRMLGRVMDDVLMCRSVTGVT